MKSDVLEWYPKNVLKPYVAHVRKKKKHSRRVKAAAGNSFS